MRMNTYTFEFKFVFESNSPDLDSNLERSVVTRKKIEKTILDLKEFFDGYKSKSDFGYNSILFRDELKDKDVYRYTHVVKIDLNDLEDCKSFINFVKFELKDKLNISNMEVHVLEKR